MILWLSSSNCSFLNVYNSFCTFLLVCWVMCELDIYDEIGLLCINYFRVFCVIYDIIPLFHVMLSIVILSIWHFIWRFLFKLTSYFSQRAIYFSITFLSIQLTDVDLFQYSYFIGYYEHAVLFQVMRVYFCIYALVFFQLTCVIPVIGHNCADRR